MTTPTDLDQALTNIADSLEAHGLTQSTIGTRECIELADYLRRCAAYAARLQVMAGACAATIAAAELAEIEARARAARMQ